MRSSWILFAIGVVLGTVAVSLLFVTTSYLYLSLLLLILANALTTQSPGSGGDAGDPEPPPAVTSDREEWRRFGREFVSELPVLIRNVVVVVVLFLLWKLMAGRYPFLSEVPRRILLAMLVAALWSLQVMAPFRSRRRRLASRAA